MLKRLTRSHRSLSTLSQTLGATSTAEDVINNFSVDLTGKNVAVTGASSGIGTEAARVFARAGANVIAFGRDLSKTQNVADAINIECSVREKRPNKPRVSVVQCDLGSISSVRAAAETVEALKIPIHVLLNNGGIGFTPNRQVTMDGLEVQFGTNHVGHFLLANLLTDALVTGGPSRVVNVSSRAHLYGGPGFNDLNWEKSYEQYRSYGASKTCNILHAVALQARLGEDNNGGGGVTACSLHPGVIATELWRHDSLDNQSFEANKAIVQGAATSVFCAVAPGIVGGGYYDDCCEAEVADYAAGPAAADELWSATERILKNIEK